ncbi:SMC family ATPase [Rathayibacter soli]|uniref:SMC family ATPase n=1 Tax=Rathayibacter soli TaxID=3144168 RepID=UPI0027E5A2B7|nr:SMC family ATPase [Glaciibacter superstes]
MRINRVTITGFGPYKDEQTVDFDAYADDGIFLIGGKTGAGKSSILDAICYALYNGVPRYDDTEARLRSDHCGPDDPTLVTLEFTVGELRYRIERSPDYERPKKRGEGTTTAPAEARLARMEGDGWVGLHDGPRDVALAVDELVRLKKDQFLQVILLAQNRFQQFLLAKNDQRQTLLRTLFGTRRFRDYEESLLAASTALAKDVELGQQKASQYLTQAAPLLAVEATLESVDAGLVLLRDAVSDAGVAASESDAQYRAAQLAHDERKTLHDRQQRRQRATNALAQLAQQAEAIDADRVALRAAERADTVWPFVTARRAAASEETTALAEETAARDSYAVFGAGEAAVSAASFTSAFIAAEVDRLSKLLGSLEMALTTETSLPTLRKDVDTAAAARAAADARVDGYLVRQAALPALLAAVRGTLSAAQLLATTEQSAQTTLGRHTAARAAAALAAALVDQLRVAEEQTLQAGIARTASSAALDELRHRRLHGHAAELATQLVDGEPCSVCGSRAHPRPAHSDTPLITEADIQAAEDALAAAEKTAKAAEKSSNALRVQLSEQTAKAGDLSVDDLDELIRATELELRAARAAADEAVRAAAELQKLETEQRALDEQLEAAREVRQAASAELTTAQTTLAAAEATTNTHRGEYETVAARHAALTEQSDAATTLARALAASAQAQQTLTAAASACTEQLRASAFDTEDEAERSRANVSEQEKLRVGIRTHDDALVAANATLAEPDLQNLADETVDVETSRAALEAAESQRDTARALRDQLIATEQQATGLATDARNATAAVAALTERYEIVRKLAATLHGDTPNTKRMKLEAYVLAAQLEEIVAAANGRLRQMTGGRYLLEHSDALSFRNTQSGLGVTILDLHTGRSRSTNSLSGGETFLASLALALGLAEVVTSRAGGITLDTLFIDEGFGSLDSETLEIAMATLDSLRAGGRTVGLISHAEAMKEQIPAKLAIEVADGGWSVIRQ